MRIYENLLETIGNTPLVKMHRITEGCRGLALAKVEAFNPGGSVKDRIGIHMIDAAEKSGELKPGGTIVENTSGNTGLGLAIVAAVRGYKAIFTMPDKVSSEKSALLKSFGAEVRMCPTAVEPDDPDSYYSVAARLAKEINGAYYPNQYFNDANPEAHYLTTGPELWQDTDGKITHFVAGMGTGGTISGIAKYLKEKNPDIQIIGVDPVGSLYTGFFKTGVMGEAHTYKIEGVGEDIMPSTMDFTHVDRVIQVGDVEAFRVARRLCREEALFTGSSGGMAMCAAMQVAQEIGPDDIMVVLIPDTGERYLSKVYNEDWLEENQLLDPGLAYTAREIAARKTGTRELVSIGPDATAMQAINLMREKDLSQLPVIDQAGELIGGLREAGVIELLLEGESATGKSVREVMEGPFPVVQDSTPAEEIYGMLSGGSPAVLLPKAGGGYRVISKWDLIHTISGKRG